MKCFEKVTVLQGKSAKNWNTLGQLLVKAKRPADAARAYRQAVKLDPSYANTQMVLGQAYSVKGNIDKAVDAYLMYVRIHESGPSVDDAKNRIAGLRNIPLEQLEQELASQGVGQAAAGGEAKPVSASDYMAQLKAKLAGQAGAAAAPSTGSGQVPAAPSFSPPPLAAPAPAPLAPPPSFSPPTMLAPPPTLAAAAPMAPPPLAPLRPAAPSTGPEQAPAAAPPPLPQLAPSAPSLPALPTLQVAAPEPEPAPEPVPVAPAPMPQAAPPVAPAPSNPPTYSYYPPYPDAPRGLCGPGFGLCRLLGDRAAARPATGPCGRGAATGPSPDPRTRTRGPARSSVGSACPGAGGPAGTGSPALGRAFGRRSVGRNTARGRRQRADQAQARFSVRAFPRQVLCYTPPCRWSQRHFARPRLGKGPTERRASPRRCRSF